MEAPRDNGKASVLGNREHYFYLNFDLGEFLDRIVEVVIKEVRTEPLDVAIHTVGLHQPAEHFNNKVFNQSELSEHTTTVGI
ncbi:hypothetical protein KI387_033272, partial [Taxus chinensis]